MSKLPVWARKPKHRKEVVATSRGWMVKETGEYLKLVRDLDTKLADLNKEAQESLDSVEKEAPSKPTQEPKKEEPEQHPSEEEKSSEKEPEATTEKKKTTTRKRKTTAKKNTAKTTGRRRGRPPKKKAE